MAGEPSGTAPRLATNGRDFPNGPTPPSRSVFPVPRRNPPRFDGAAAWSRLTRGERDELGPLMLEFVVAEAGARLSPPGGVYTRTFVAAADLANNGLHRLAAEILPQEIFFGGTPPIPAIVGDVCRHCGCTEFDACDGGCFWVAPGLCSACSAEGLP